MTLIMSAHEFMSAYTWASVSAHTCSWALMNSWALMMSTHKLYECSSWALRNDMSAQGVFLLRAFHNWGRAFLAHSFSQLNMGFSCLGFFTEAFHQWVILFRTFHKEAYRKLVWIIYFHLINTHYTFTICSFFVYSFSNGKTLE